MPWRARPRSRVRARSGLAIEVDLVDDRAGDLHAVALEQRGVEHDLVDRPADAALGHDDRRRAEHRRDAAFDSPMTAPTPACPVPSMSSMSRSAANEAWASRIRAGRSSTTSPSMYAWVKPRGMWTGLIRPSGSGSPNTAFIRTASSSAGTPSSMTVRWPTGLKNPVERPRRPEPVEDTRG